MIISFYNVFQLLNGLIGHCKNCTFRKMRATEVKKPLESVRNMRSMNGKGCQELLLVLSESLE